MSQLTSPPRIFVMPSTHHASGNYRMRMPAYALRKAGLATVLVNEAVPMPGNADITLSGLPDIKIIKALAPDTIVMQMPFGDEQIRKMQAYRREESIFLIYEIDDLLWDMNASNPNNWGFPKDIKQRVARAAKLCDRVVCSTEALRERIINDLGVKPDRVVVMLNRIPDWFVSEAIAAPRKGERGRPRIGWAGGISHADDLAILKPVVEQTLDRYQWVFMGSCPEGLRDKVEFHPAVGFEEYPRALGQLDLDLAVAPLVDTPFNRCKSNLRVMEYAAAGFPVLASAVGPFLHCHNSVMRTTNDTKAWITTIEQAFEHDIQSRAQASHDNLRRHTLETEHGLDAVLHSWVHPDRPAFTPAMIEQPDTKDLWNLGIVGEPLRIPLNDVVDVVPRYASIAEACAEGFPKNILFLRPGTVPTFEQISLAMFMLEGRDTVSATSNDGDYPFAGRFTPLPGTMARDMADAALNGCQGDVIDVPFPGGPMILISGSALARLGIPDEARYSGDIEQALLEWSMRGTGKHVIAQEIFVPVPMAARRAKEATEAAIREITTWHPNLVDANQAAAAGPIHAQMRRNVDLAFHALGYESPPAKSYAEWHEMHDAWTFAALGWANTEYTGMAQHPKISIVMPTYNPDPVFFKAAIDSVLEQSYPDWELIIVDDGSADAVELDAQYASDERITVIDTVTNSGISEASNRALQACTGEWVLFLDHDDTLAPCALHMLVREVLEHPKTLFVYGDSDLINPAGELTNPFFKPDFDYDLLLAQNYVCHPALYKLHIVQEIGGFRKEFDGSQDYDLILRYMDHACFGSNTSQAFSAATRHVPMVLYHWRQAPTSVSANIMAKPQAIQAAQAAVIQHLSRAKKSAFVGSHPAAPLHHLIRWMPPSPEPLVSIIILTEQNASNIERCLGSILTRTAYKNFEVLVRQGGEDKTVGQVIRKFAGADKRIRHLTGAAMRPFSFALLCNAIAQNARGEVLVFLNDDTEILENAWLHDMVGCALRPDIGATGVRLIYPSGSVQHDGVIWDSMAARGESALHVFAGTDHRDPGPFGGAAFARQRLAVTAACMAIRAELFHSIKGFDHGRFPLDYNDVDLCFRLHKKGYRNIVLSHITVAHMEGATKQITGATCRSEMFEAETRLRELYADLVDGTLNPNIQFEPSQQRMVGMPPRAWLHEERLNILLIGATDQERRMSWISGARPYCAELFGTQLQFVMPAVQNMGSIDLRHPEVLGDVIDRLGIQRIVLRRLGAGSTDALGALSAMARDGFPVDYWQGDYAAVCPRLDCHNSLGACQHEWKKGFDSCQVCVDRDGSPFGYVSVGAYRVAWQHFMNTLEAAREKQKIVQEPVDD